MGDRFAFVNTDFSIVLWMKMAAGENRYQIACAKHQHGVYSGYILGANQAGSYGSPGKAWFYNSEPEDTMLISTSDVNDGQWHQVVATYDLDGDRAIYVDGIPAESTALVRPIIDNDAPFRVGGDSAGGGYYVGEIDELQLYDRVLNAQEVQRLYENPGSAIPEPGTLALALVGVCSICLCAFRRPKG